MKEILSQILGLAVTFICIVTPQLKQKWQLLISLIAANLLAGVSYLLIGQISATGVGVVAMVQALSSLLHPNPTGKSRFLQIPIFGGLYLLGWLLPHWMGNGFLKFTVLDFLPLLGAWFLMLSIVQKKEQNIRLFVLMNAVVFMIYTAILRNTQFFAQLFTAGSALLALIRYRKQTESKDNADARVETERENKI